MFIWMWSLYQSNLITFLAYDNEHHRILLIILEDLNVFQKNIMKFKIFLNKKIPTIEGLDHISYRINPIEKWFNFYFKAKERGLKPLWTVNHGWISGK